MPTAQQPIADLLRLADIGLDGRRPHDLQVHNDRFYTRVLAEGVLGFGESYMDGDWDCAALDEMLYQAIRAGLEKEIQPLKMLLPVLRAKLINRQRKARAFEIGDHHYDMGNDLYTRMLDQRMTYSCAYWKDATDLDAAQEAKLDLICRKLDLRPGMRVLDIGCGWGSWAGYAAEKYGVSVVGITVSRAQIDWARERYAGMDIEFRYQDYRDLRETFDRIVSVGMFEHVGPKNYRTFMEVVDRSLIDEGYFLLHTIGSPVSRMTVDPWTDKYIFPGAALPSAVFIAKAIEGLFVLRDWHSFGGDYGRTLLAWHDNFASSWPEIADRYGERFRRMWRYYLLSAAAGFRANRNQLWQIVLVKPVAGPDYQAVR